MTELATNPRVFIRSLATRGATGGLARAALDAVDILDAGGFRTIIIETVGVGQDEVEIATASTTTVVVSAPGLGDDIQALKAGMLEIADIHVVSKCDRKDAYRTIADLKQMLAAGARLVETPEWRVPVIGVSAVADEGLDTLVEALLRHQTISSNGSGDARRARIAEFRISKTAELLVLDRLRKKLKPLCAEFAPEVIERRRDPYTVASQLIQLKGEMDLYE
jgi:LAO/AO transport system kinase